MTTLERKVTSCSTLEARLDLVRGLLPKLGRNGTYFLGRAKSNLRRRGLTSATQRRIERAWDGLRRRYAKRCLDF